MGGIIGRDHFLIKPENNDRSVLRLPRGSGASARKQIEKPVLVGGSDFSIAA
jgi:hypothetical protein